VQEASHVIHVVDDDSSFRSAIARLLNAAGYEVALYETSQQLLEKPPTNMSDCILLDVQMSGLSGPQLQDRLSELGNRLPIVFLTGHGDIPMGVRAMKEGAVDFLTKPATEEALFAAVRAALERDRDARLAAAELDVIERRLATLTPREAEVMRHVIAGKPNKRIADDLGTTEKTVKVHRGRVMAKMGAQSVAQLVRLTESAKVDPAV
jgi:FixJ family two-component response regulator